VSLPPKIAPELHTRLRRERSEGEKWQRLARQLAEALDAEVDLRLGVRGDEKFIRSQSGYILNVARREGLL